MQSREYVGSSISDLVIDNSHFATREYVDLIVSESSNLAAWVLVDTIGTSNYTSRQYGDNMMSESSN